MIKMKICVYHIPCSEFAYGSFDDFCGSA